MDIFCLSIRLIEGVQRLNGIDVSVTGYSISVLYLYPITQVGYTICE